jgi:hypothetical protein
MDAGAQTAPQPLNPINDRGGVVLLAPDTAISVQVGRHWHRCAFGSAHGEWLECSSHLAPGMLGALIGGVIGHPTVHGRQIYERPAQGGAAGISQH